MSKKHKNKSGWDFRRKAVAVLAGLMALLLLVPILAQIFTLALA